MVLLGALEGLSHVDPFFLLLFLFALEVIFHALLLRVYATGKVINQADLDILLLLRSHVLELIGRILKLDLVAVLERGGGGRNVFFLILSYPDGLLLDLEVFLLIDLLLIFFGQHFLLAAADVEYSACLLNVSHGPILIDIGVCVVQHEFSHRSNLSGSVAQDAFLAAVVWLRALARLCRLH